MHAMNSPQSAIERFVATAKQLHSLPAVAMEALELTSNPKVDTSALKKCIENDPALTAKILRVVNSSLFGLSREVSDLNQALALLGTKPLKLLVLGFSLPKGMYEGIEAETLAQHWRHTLTKAVAAREISETFWNQPGDEAFIAGLLQDIAVPVLLQELGEPYARLLEKSQAASRDLAPLEVQAMGFDHTELTARLLEHWGLPSLLIDTVRWKPADPSALSGGARRQREILELAELTAQLLAEKRPDVLPRLLKAGRDYRGIGKEQLDQVVERLEGKVAQLADVLSLQLAGGLDYRDVLTQAHAQLADVAQSAAEELIGGSASTVENESLAVELQLLSEAVARVATDRTPRRITEPKAAATPPAPAGVAWRGASAATATVAPPPVSAPTTTLLRSLDPAVAACRRSRCALSLLLVELSNTEDPLTHSPTPGAGEILRSVESLCRGIDHDYCLCQSYGEFGFSLILADCDRRNVVRLGNRLIQRFGELPALASAGGPRSVGIGVGAATVALPPKNFPAQDLILGAGRCLYGAHASGGGVVKSIEIY
jgi:HD-like signal output (HDOD) protein